MGLTGTLQSGHTFAEPSDTVTTADLNNQFEQGSTDIPTPIAIADGGTGGATAQTAAKNLEAVSEIAEWIEFNSSGSPPEVTLGALPADSFVADVQIFVDTNFDSTGTDEIRIGTSADPDEISVLEDVSTTGLKTPTRGVTIYTTTQKTIIAQFVQSIADATQGKALCVVRFAQVPTRP